MKYHTIKSERYNLRAGGAYASYPVYLHETGERVGTLESYAENVDTILKAADLQGSFAGVGVYPWKEGE